MAIIEDSIDRLSRQMLKKETSHQTKSNENHLPLPKDSIVYFGFYGRRHIFSNFYPTPLQYKTLILNSEGKPEEPEKYVILDFKSAEALYQWKKATSSPQANKCYTLSQESPVDGELCCSIRNAATASVAKQLGRVCVKVNKSSWCLENRIAAMREVINLKFPAVHPNQMPSNWHPGSIYKCPAKSNGSLSLSIQLLYTGNAVLLENSPYDKIWGTGKSDKEFDVLIKKLSLNTKQSLKKHTCKRVSYTNSNRNHRTRKQNIWIKSPRSYFDGTTC